jgi:hypothetical protein
MSDFVGRAHVIVLDSRTNSVYCMEADPTALTTSMNELSMQGLKAALCQYVVFI